MGGWGRRPGLENLQCTDGYLSRARARAIMTRGAAADGRAAPRRRVFTSLSSSLGKRRFSPRRVERRGCPFSSQSGDWTAQLRDTRERARGIARALRRFCERQLEGN